jgi:GNAT superfamily N-acetyltransferase
MTTSAVRRASTDDLKAAAELRWRWACEGNRTPAATHDEFVLHFVEWARHNASTHTCFLVARDDEVVGMAWLAVLPRVPHPAALDRRSGDVQCVYVVPGERNTGLGGMLIDAVLARATEVGLERVVVHSSERAITAYARHGFEVSPRLLQTEVAR